MRVVLEIVAGPETGRKVELAPGQTVRVGRTKRSDVEIAKDTFLSGVHFEVECDAQGVRVRDLKSRNSTFLNGQKVGESALKDGDRIFAGETTFAVRIEREPAAPPPSAHAPASGSAPTVLLPGLGALAAQMPQAGPAAAGALEQTVARGAEESPAAATPQEGLLHLLRNQPEPLFALLDAARDPKVLQLLRGSEAKHQSLYEGPQGKELDPFAPYLVALPAESALLETLAREGWGKSWGCYLTSRQTFERVRRHFRQFLLVKAEDGRELYFRFYDPRVLRAFLPTCTAEETTEFFGSISAYLVEAEQPENLLRFTSAPQGLERSVLPLARPAAPAPAGR